MAKSDYAQAAEDIQGTLRLLLKARGFKVRGRAFNRVTEDGLTQVVSIQMGASDPPGTTYIPRLLGALLSGLSRASDAPARRPSRDG